MPKRKKLEEMPEAALSAEELARRAEGLRILEEAARKKRRMSEAEEIIRRGKQSRKRFRLSNNVRDGVAGYLFILPWIIGFLLFFLSPLIESAVYSLHRVQLDPGTGKFVLSDFGITHYRTMFTTQFTDYIMWEYGPAMLQLLNKLPIAIILSLFVAIMLNQKFKGRTVFRAIFFLPVIIASGILISIIAGDMNAITNTRDLDQAGGQIFTSGASYVYHLLARLNIPDYTIGFVRNMVNGIFNTVWNSGIQILLFLSALQTIPTSFYEASTIEGASGWVTFWKITFPMVSPFILVNIVYTVVDTFSDTSRGPLAYIIRQSKADWGYSAACAWVYFVSVGIILSVLLGIINKFVFYQVD